MTSTPKGFKGLRPPSASATLAEVNGIFLTKGDTLPRKFEEKNYAPLIELKSFSPLYTTRVKHRASTILARTLANNPHKGPIWKLIYYVDLPRMKLAELYYSIQRLRSTPGDLLARYILTQSIGRGLELTGEYMRQSEWCVAAEKELLRFLGTDIVEKKRKKEKEVDRSGDDEKIEHIAFHPTMMVLAMATTSARVHLFDLRTNVFLGYYLVAADDPSDLAITSLAFNSANQLAVGLDTGCVDVWTVDLSALRAGEWTLTNTPRKALGPLFAAAMLKTPEPSGSPFGYRGSPSKQTPLSRSFFDTKPSPETMNILKKQSNSHKATLARVQLVTEAAASQDKLVGAVTVVAFSPSGKHLAIGTSKGGVWIYNLIQETSFRAYTGSFTAASTKCTCLTWGVPPGVNHLPLKGEGEAQRYQYETGSTVLIAGMESGLIMYIQIRENGASGITVDTSPVEFYPSKVTREAPEDTGISQVLLVPSQPAVEGVEQLYASFPTLVVSFVDSPGIHIFRLIPKSLLKASVPSASSAPSTPTEATPKPYSQITSQELYKMAIDMAGKFIRNYCGTHDGVEVVHVGTLNTSYVIYPLDPSRRRTALPEAGCQETIRQSHIWNGYGGIVKSMAIDPTARRFIVSFSPDTGGSLQDSIVWFDASAITSSASTLRALGVLRPQRVINGDRTRTMGEVSFAGGFEGGACAGMVLSDGKGVGILPAWIEVMDDKESLGEGYKWCGNEAL